MSAARLPAGLEAAALRRLAESSGGHAAVLHRGDSDRGAILLVLAERGEAVALVERVLTPDGQYRWHRRDAQNVQDSVAKSRRFDSDLWVIEVDIADAERFIVESLGQG